MIIPIEKINDVRIKGYLGLQNQTKQRRREAPGGDRFSTFLAEGLIVINRALAAGHQMHSVLVDGNDAEELDAYLAHFDPPIYAASPEVLIQICGRPKLRDAIGCFERPALPLASELIARTDTRTVAVLEGIVNPTNVGVIARCAAGLGVDAMLIDPTCADPMYRRAVRVSMGEIFSLPHTRISQIPSGLMLLKESGFELLALSPVASATDIDEVVRARGDKIAIMLGTEGGGLSEAALAAATIHIRIPMQRNVDSINVGSAAAVAFHALRARQ